MGIVGSLLRHAAEVRSSVVSGIALGLLTTGSLLIRFSEDLSSLGGGLWVNLTMFGTMSILHGIAATIWAERLAAMIKRMPDTDPWQGARLA